MSKKEEILTILDGIKTLIVTFLSALFGVLGYSVINYDKLVTFQAIVIAIATISLLLIVSILLKIYIKKAKQLRDL